MRKIKIACMTNHYNYVYIGSMLEKYRAARSAMLYLFIEDLTWKAPFGEGAFFLQYLLKTKTLCILTDAFQQLLWSNIDTSQICWLQQWKLSLIFNGLHILVHLDFKFSSYCLVCTQPNSGVSIFVDGFDLWHVI